ncbi:hypothetical protein D3C77_733010 [compost metagenome]
MGEEGCRLILVLLIPLHNSLRVQLDDEQRILDVGRFVITLLRNAAYGEKSAVRGLNDVI